MRELETPCIVVDMEIARRNIERMQARADSYGCALRPHIKTHKMPLFARMQMEAGAAGITCAKVSEAEVMADGGLKDIFIAYPLVGNFRIRRALALQKRLDRLILAVDSIEGARMLEEASAKAGTTVEVRLEVDTGAKRTGVVHDKVSSVAKTVANMPHLRLTGIYTFKSLLYQGMPTEDNALAGEEEGRLMAKIAENLRAEGIDIRDVSAGSSPTGLVVASTGLVNEIRPGTYIFNDLMLCEEHVASQADIAAKFHLTVVSCPDESYAILDGGTKTFPADVPVGEDSLYPGYAVVEGREDLLLRRMNEEHGILTSRTGKHGLCVGQQLTLLPVHVCTAINLQNEVYLLENGEMRKEKVGARGMLV